MRGADERARIDVQLRLAGGAGAAGSSAARDPPDHRSGARAAVAALRHAVRQFRPAVDSAGAAAARAAAAGALHDSQRAAADGAAGLQPAVSLVRGLGMDDAVWSPTTFTKNRDRLLDGDIAAAFFEAVLIHADTRAAAVGRALHGRRHAARGVGESEELPAARSRIRRAGRRRQSDRQFPGERRRNATHQSTTDPDARLYKKARGREAQLGYLGHVLMENRSGLIVDATGDAGRRARRTRRRAGDGRGHPRSAAHHGRRRTRATTPATSSPSCGAMRRTPHVAQTHRRAGGSAIDGRTTRHPGYAVSQRKRKLVEQALRLDEDRRRPAQAAAPRRPAGHLDLHLHRRGLQHRPAAPLAAGDGVTGHSGRVGSAVDTGRRAAPTA